MILQETYELSNGVSIPKLGLGTWLMDDAQAAQAVQDALALGYRHIDTAQAYGNEHGVGEGVRASGLAREDVFVTTKVAAELKSHQEAAASIDESLSKLGMDYADLILIHSPQPWAVFNRTDNRYHVENQDVWRALEDAYEAGKARAIGVSNFLAEDIENILKAASVPPMADQVLAHVSNTPFALIDYCQRKDILVEAYSPIAHGAVLDNPQIAAIAEHYGVSVAQLCIRYTLQLGLLPLPKTANPSHMEADAQVDFQISDEDMEALKNVDPIEDYGEHGYFPVFGGKM